MAKIIHKKEECISCGACVSICPDHWEMGNDGKSHLKDSKQDGENFVKEVDEVGCNKDAADSCPVHVIKIEE